MLSRTFISGLFLIAFASTSLRADEKSKASLTLVPFAATGESVEVAENPGGSGSCNFGSHSLFWKMQPLKPCFQFNPLFSRALAEGETVTKKIVDIFYRAGKSLQSNLFEFCGPKD